MLKSTLRILSQVCLGMYVAIVRFTAYADRKKHLKNRTIIRLVSTLFSSSWVFLCFKLIFMAFYRALSNISYARQTYVIHAYADKKSNICYVWWLNMYYILSSHVIMTSLTLIPSLGLQWLLGFSVTFDGPLFLQYTFVILASTHVRNTDVFTLFNETCL